MTIVGRMSSRLRSCRRRSLKLTRVGGQRKTGQQNARGSRSTPGMKARDDCEVPESKRPSAATQVHQQSFAVHYDYPVYFTRDVFDPANLCLRSALTRLESDKRHRIAVFVDEGVTLACPDLLSRISRYAEHNADA